MPFPLPCTTQITRSIYPLAGDPANITSANAPVLSADGAHMYWYDNSPAWRIVRQRLSDDHLDIIVSGVDLGDRTRNTGKQAGILSPDGLFIYWYSSLRGSCIKLDLSDHSYVDLGAVTPAAGGITATCFIGWKTSTVAWCFDSGGRGLYMFDFSTSTVTKYQTFPWFIGTAGISSGVWDGVRYMYLLEGLSGNGGNGIIIRLDMLEGELTKLVAGAFANVGLSLDTGVPAYRQRIHRCDALAVDGGGYLYYSDSSNPAGKRLRRINLASGVDQIVFTTGITSNIAHMIYIPQTERLWATGDSNIHQIF